MDWSLDSALGVLITQIGGRKRKGIPVSRIAEAAAYAVDTLGSAQAVADEIRRPSARAQINDFVAIHSLPQEVKKNYVDRNLIGIEASSELSRLPSPSRVREVARVISGLKAREAMQVISYSKANPNLSASRSKQRVLASRDKRRELDVLVIPLDHSEFLELVSHSRKAKRQPVDLAAEIVKRWLIARRPLIGGLVRGQTTKHH